MLAGRCESELHLVKSFLDLKPNFLKYVLASANDRNSYFPILLHPDNTLIDTSAVFVSSQVEKQEVSSKDSY